MKMSLKMNVLPLFLITLLLVSFAAYAAADSPVIPGEGITVIADTPEIYAEIISLGMSEENSAYEAEIYFCNRSDYSVEVNSEYAAINGYVMDSYMFDVVPPRHRSFIYLDVFDEDLEQAGIESVDSLSFRFSVVYSEPEASGEVFKKDVTVFPTGLRPDEVPVKAIKDIPTENYQFAQLTFSNEFIDFRVLDAKPTENGFFYQITAVAENLSGKDILLSGANFIVDGVETEPYWYCRIPKGMKAVTDIWLDAEILANYGVTEMDTVSFTLTLYESMDYNAVDNSVPFFAYPLSFRPAKG